VGWVRFQIDACLPTFRSAFVFRTAPRSRLRSAC